MLVSTADVQARWGYSEILDGTFAKHYDPGPYTPDLRAKRQAGTPFEDLTADEKYSLAFLSSYIRVNLLLYVAGVEHFELVQLDRATLGRLIVPPNVWKDSNSQFYAFSHYATTRTNEAGDARTIVIDPSDYRVPTDPIIVGRRYQHPILIDGYHRAVAFWKFGPASGSLPAYVARGAVV